MYQRVPRQKKKVWKIMATIFLAKPRGFCAGVERAVDIVKLALKKLGKPIYVRHEIVHNQHVVNSLKEKGAVFVDELNNIPEGSTVVFSAHGVSPQIKQQAANLGLNVIDATCPLVTKVHIEAKLYYGRGYSIVLIGHKNHQEVIGTIGYSPMMLVENIEDVKNLDIKNDKIMCLTQTTLSMDDTKEIIKALKEKYPNVNLPPKEDICYATQNRQNAVKELAKKCDLILVIGAKNSSNSNRLVDTAEHMNVESHLIQSYKDIKDVLRYTNIGIISGASTPEILVKEVIDYLKTVKAFKVENLDVIDEDIKFPLPRGLTEGIIAK